MKIMIVTDAWRPQVNGVVRTLESTQKQLINLGHNVQMLTPEGSRTIPCPTYPEIPLVLSPYSKVEMAFDSFVPDAVHIATEGSLGWAARRHCKRAGLHFTTSFHTRFPEYIQARTHLPKGPIYRVLRRFHSLARRVMVNTQSMEHRLLLNGFKNLKKWSRGVDTELFRPLPRSFSTSKPKLLYVGRVAVEKNLEAFLNLQIDSVKIVVGDGPQLLNLKRKYPEVLFAGAKTGEDLVYFYAMADVFVFPSLTDTFGLVMLEALACGTPVAAFPTEGPIDVIQSSEVGSLDRNLERAVQTALRKSRRSCRDYAMQFSWEKCTRQFVDNLIPAIV